MGKVTGDVAAAISGHHKCITDLDKRVERIENATISLGEYARQTDDTRLGEDRRRFCLHEAQQFQRNTNAGIVSAGAVIALADEFDRYVVQGAEGMPDAKAEKLNAEALVRAVVDRAYPTRYRIAPEPITINPSLTGFGGGQL